VLGVTLKAGCRIHTGSFPVFSSGGNGLIHGAKAYPTRGLKGSHRHDALREIGTVLCERGLFRVVVRGSEATRQGNKGNMMGCT
jgi:hypothetical protein